MATGKDSAVVKIAADITDPQRKIAEINSLIKKMGDNINVQSGVAVKAFRSEADEAQVLLKQLGASEAQMASLARTTRAVEAQADAFHEKLGGAAQKVSGVFFMMARAGEASGREVKELVREGGEFATMFGAEGAVIGAITFAGLAIYSFFNRTRQEIEDTRKKAQEELIKLANSTDLMQVAERLRKITSGDTGAQNLAAHGVLGRDMTTEEVGIAGLQARIAQQKAALPETPRYVDVGSRAGHTRVDVDQAAREALADDEARLTELLKERNQVEVVYTTLLAHENEMVKVGAQLAKEKGLSAEKLLELSRKRVEEMMKAEKAMERDEKITHGGIEAQNAAFNDANPLPRNQSHADAMVGAILKVDAATSAVAGLADVTGPSVWERIAAGISDASSAALDFRGNLELLATGTVKGFADASVNAFVQWAGGTKKIGDALRQGVGSAIVDIAGQKAKLYFAEALADTAEGFLGHPGAWAAAGEHAAAAAAMLAIAGGGARIGATGATGGGGGRSAAFNASQSSAIGSAAKGTATIYLSGGKYFPLDDVRALDELADAVRAAGDRNIIIREG